MFKEFYRTWCDSMATVLGEGVRSGEFREDIDTGATARLIVAMVDGIYIQAIMKFGAETDPASLKALTAGIVSMVSAPTGGASSGALRL